jgi:AmmeMemoRadiSam system protein B
MAGRVRRAAVAGSFYPRDPAELTATIDGFLADARERETSHGPIGRVRAIVVPHAGYVYSGPIAAAAYATVLEHRADYARVVVIGPAHRVPLRGVAVSSADELATPLGPITVDAAARERLLQLAGTAIDDGAHELEHSIEVQLPFLRRVLPGLPVLPLVVGVADRAAVVAVLDAVWDDDTLLVVSTDLSHYLDYASARTVDASTAARIVAADAGAIADRDACGAYALRPLLDVGRRRELVVEQLDLRSSGDTAGPRDRVVGYGAFALEESA